MTHSQLRPFLRTLRQRAVSYGRKLRRYSADNRQSNKPVTVQKPARVHIENLARLARATGDVGAPYVAPVDGHALSKPQHAAALSHIWRLPDALTILGETQTDDVNGLLWRAELSLRLCETARAQKALDMLDEGTISPDLAGRHALVRADLLSLTQGNAAARDVLEDYLAQHPTDQKARLQQIRLIADDPQRADEAAQMLLSQAGGDIAGHAQERRLLIDIAERHNLGLWIQPFLLKLIAANPNDTDSIRAAINIAWMSQDAATLDRLITSAAALSAMPYGMLKSAREREKAFPAFSRLLDAARRHTDVATKVASVTADNYKPLGASARRHGLLGTPEAGLALVDRILDEFPFLVWERYIRAELLDVLGRSQEALAEACNVITHAPQISEPYALAFEIMSRQPGQDGEIAALLDNRSKYVRRFRQRPDLSTPPHDKQRFLHAFHQGDLPEAIRHRTGRPANRLLRAMFPGAVPGLDRQALDQNTPLGKIGVISWIGIADEVRWAQTYGLLPDYAKQGVVSCEPRLLAIMTRSFPQVTFVPVRRRWPLLWQDRPILRTDIRERYLAGYLNRSFADSLHDCDAVFFPEEIAAQLLKYSPAAWHAHVATLSKGYLQPLAAKASAWDARMRRLDRPTIGLVWRSGIVTPSRVKHFLALQDLLPLVSRTDANFVALVANPTDQEVALCKAHDILVPEGVDLFNDLEDLLAIGASLDLVFGTSSLPFELAAAAGTRTWAFALTPDAVVRRSRKGAPEVDQMTVNGRVISPSDPDFFQDRTALVADILAQTDRLLDDWIQGFQSRE